MAADNFSVRTLALWIALAAINCLVVPCIGGGWPPPHDFGMFYTAAHVYLHDEPGKLYDVDVQLQAQKQLYNVPDDQAVNRFLPYNHLPYEVLLYLPLANLSPDRAFLVWRLESLALLVFTIWLFSKTFPMQNGTGMLILIALAFFPVPYCFLAGQDTFVTLALFAVGLWLLTRQKEMLAGIALGLCLFKFQLVLPIIGIFFLRRSWRVLVGFVWSAGVVVAISTLMVGYKGMADLVHLWVRGETGGLVCVNPLTMPNIRGLLSCIPGLTPHMVAGATVLISALLLLLVTHQSGTATNVTHRFAMAICFVVLVSFHTNMYDLAILILPIMVLLEVYSRSKLTLWSVRLLLFLIFCCPLYLIAFAAFRIALLSIVVAWLWYTVVSATNEEATETSTFASTLPKSVVAHA